MGWWKRLKGWQKGAVIFGSVHLVLSFLLLQARTEGGGLILVEMVLESPWLLILRFGGMEYPGNILGYSYASVVIGTLFYGLFGALLWHITLTIKTKKKSL